MSGGKDFKIGQEKQQLLRRSSKKIAGFRDKLGVGQDEFAQMLGVSRATVGNWEQGVTPLKVEYAVRMVTVCGCSLDELFMDITSQCTTNLKHITEREREVILQGLDKLAGKDRELYDHQINGFLRLKEGLD